MNTITRTSRTKKRGFTLTEIAIVLGIVGLILGAIWVAAAAVYTNLRISHMNTDILQTVQAMRSLFASQPTIAAGDQTAAMINAGAVSKDLVQTATTLSNPWGGTMFVGGTTDSLGIAITINGMPTSACVGIVSQVAGTTTRDPGLTTVTVANANAPAVPAGTVGTPLAPTLTFPPTTGGTVAGGTGTGCTAASTTNSVVFIFTLKG